MDRVEKALDGSEAQRTTRAQDLPQEIRRELPRVSVATLMARRAAMSVPLTRPCPDCQGEMELVTTDDVGEILIYECPDCGHQEETRVETGDDEAEDLRHLTGSDLGEDDDDLESEWLEPDQEE